MFSLRGGSLWVYLTLIPAIGMALLFQVRWFRDALVLLFLIAMLLGIVAGLFS
jgi:hypothetical protein